MTNFFIYGTLKRGHGRSALLDGQHFLGEKKTAPRYRLFTTGSFPALVDAGRANVMLPGMSIEGELWQIDDECLAVLDRVEGVDSGLFERREIQLLDDEEDVDGYFWVGRVEGLEDCGGGVGGGTFGR